MALTLRETDAASDDAFDARDGCSLSLFINSTTSSKKATSGGTGGVTAVSITLDGQASDNIDTIQFESAAGEPNSTAWESGTWTVRIEITTANMNINAWKAGVCRRNSAGVPQQSLGSAIGVGDFTSTGVKTATVTGAASAGASATDQMGITIAPFHGTAKTQTFAYKPSQNIDTPVNQGGGAAAEYSGRGVGRGIARGIGR